MTIVMGFDLEQFAPEGTDASIEHPISCAVTQLNQSLRGLMLETGVDPEPWFTASGNEWGLEFSPLTSPQQAAEALTPDKVMNAEGLDGLVDELFESARAGVPAVTWHGAAYDFPCLAHHTKRYETMQYVALESIDLHVLFMAVRRHRLGLKAAAEAVGSHKGGGGVADGAEALTVWPDRWTEVLAYCAQDVQATLDVYQHLVKDGGFAWTSKKGKLMQFVLPPALRDPATWTVRNLLTVYKWHPADKWITEPASPDDDVFQWLFAELYIPVELTGEAPEDVLWPTA